jgi:hypothetical protein
MYRMAIGDLDDDGCWRRSHRKKINRMHTSWPIPVPGIFGKGHTLGGHDLSPEKQNHAARRSKLAVFAVFRPFLSVEIAFGPGYFR